MEISKPDIKVDVHEELFRKYLRVLKLARTPTREEFTKIATVAAAGTACASTPTTPAGNASQDTTSSNTRSASSSPATASPTAG